MARPQKQGLSYFPKDVDSFSDRKIRILMARYGSDGYLLYDYLLCEIYREGYYIQVDDDFLYLLSSELNMSVEKIGQMMNFLLERSLLSRTLFQSDKVLTSAGIQRRYQLGIETRARKAPVKVDARFWLLNKDETKGYVEVTHFCDSSGNNPHFSGNNSDSSGIYDTKKRKGKKEKEDTNVSSAANAECSAESSPAVIALTLSTGEDYPVQKNQVAKWRELYPAVDVVQELREMKGWTDANPGKRKTKAGILRFITGWLAREQERKEEAHDRNAKDSGTCPSAHSQPVPEYGEVL